MAGFSYRLGRKLGPKVRKATWVWKSLVGDERQRLQAEAAVGQDMIEEVLGQVRQDSDQGLAQACIQIRNNLAQRLRNQQRRFQSFIVHESQPNAFALPGGGLFITRSLLDLCNQEADWIAFVLAHEIAHIVKGHAMERLVVHAALSAANVATMRSATATWIKQTGIKALQGSYSQHQELEADALAVRLMRAAGYQPLSAIDLLTQLAQQTDPEGLGILGEYFSTHPPLNTRITEIRRVLQQP